MLEMNAGDVWTLAESFLGLRHGPMSAISPGHSRGRVPLVRPARAAVRDGPARASSTARTSAGRAASSSARDCRAAASRATTSCAIDCAAAAACDDGELAVLDAMVGPAPRVLPLPRHRAGGPTRLPRTASSRASCPASRSTPATASGDPHLKTRPRRRRDQRRPRPPGLHGVPGPRQGGPRPGLRHGHGQRLRDHGHGPRPARDAGRVPRPGRRGPVRPLLPRPADEPRHRHLARDPRRRARRPGSRSRSRTRSTARSSRTSARSARSRARTSRPPRWPASTTCTPRPSSSRRACGRTSPTSSRARRPPASRPRSTPASTRTRSGTAGLRADAHADRPLLPERGRARARSPAATTRSRACGGSRTAARGSSRSSGPKGR